MAEPVAGQELARAELGGTRGRGVQRQTKLDEGEALRSRRQAEAGAVGMGTEGWAGMNSEVIMDWSVRCGGLWGGRVSLEPSSPWSLRVARAGGQARVWSKDAATS